MIATIFGDVHGNLVALEKLFKIENHQTDIFICHGDVVNYGPWTNQCIAFLDTIPNFIPLLGNHELFFLEGFYNGTNLIANAFFDHCYANFDTSFSAKLQKYNLSFELDNIVIQHTINNQYIFADTDISNIEINSNFIIGHSHQQFQRKKDNFDIVNTGSLGQNREFINKSCYIKYDTITKKIELKSFIHDINIVINQMKSEKYPAICINYYLSKKIIL
jgi:predicted phosphodiesterase